MIIDPSDEVEIRDTDATASVVAIDVGGKLSFTPTENTELGVVTLLVLGELEIGTASTPIANDVTATVTFLDVPIDLTSDPAQYGNGLLALHSAKVTVHGATLPETFIRLAQEPSAGDNTLVLEQVPTGWQVGDQLILPDTRMLHDTERYLNYSPQWEELTIAAIDDNVITLNRVLQFDHVGARDGNGVLEFLPHVVNRSRNVVFESENPNGTRGHTAFQGRSDIDVRYASFKHLGRTRNEVLDNTTFDENGNATHIGTNQIARYAIHAHHLVGGTSPQANGYQYTLVGNSVDNGTAEHDFKWGIAIHASHYGLIKQNTVYNVAGAAVVTEDGSESYNVFEKNFVVRAYSRGDEWRYSLENGQEHTAREATGFWFRGPLNYVRDNVATNVVQYGRAITGWGFKYLLRYTGKVTIPSHQGAMPMMSGTEVNMNQTPILEFDGNEVYGAIEGGLTYWWVGTIGNVATHISGRSVIKDFRIWHAFNVGIYSYQSHQITVDGLVIRGDRPERLGSGVIGFHPGDYFQKDLVITNADIQGMRVGIDLPEFSDGLTIVENSYLRNHLMNLRGRTHFNVNGSSTAAPKSAEIRNTHFDNWINNTTTHVYMHYWARDRANLIQSDDVYVYDYNGVPGDDFRVYYLEQAPDFVVPQTGSSSGLTGSPVAGLTNQENWTQYGLAIAGSIAPTRQQRPGILGYVQSLTANNPPLATPDLRAVREDGQSITGFVLSNDRDADGDTLTVTQVDGNAANVGSSLTGSYGTVVINRDGSYTYTLDNSNPIVQLLDNGETLTEFFTYTASDGTAISSASLTITIQGASDNSAPVAVNDTISITEDGKHSVMSNVLGNDTDADGDSLFVSRVERSSDDVGQTIDGSYGTLQINSDGSYQYTLDNANPAVDDMNSGQTLSESFDYSTSDGHLSDEGRLTITIQGSTDNHAPVAADDLHDVMEDVAGPVSGNVLSNDADADGDLLSVSRVEGSASNVGVTINGNYGTLQINSDGTYHYTLDDTNAAVNALDLGQTLSESFGYSTRDGRLSDDGNLTITIYGSTDNQPPVAADDSHDVMEGAAPSVTGNVLTNDTDADGDLLSVSRVEGSSSNVGVTINGSYGMLQINSDGSYRYTLDETIAAVNALDLGRH